MSGPRASEAERGLGPEAKRMLAALRARFPWLGSLSFVESGPDTGSWAILCPHCGADARAAPCDDGRRLELRCLGEPPCEEAAMLADLGRNGAEAEPEDHESLALAPIPSYPLDALPDPARQLVDHGARAGLPAALVAGATIAAAAGAIGGRAQLELAPGNWVERAIVWVPLIAPRGAGKSPSQALAFAPLEAHDRQLIQQLPESADDERKDVPELLADDATMEAFARKLDESDAGCVTLVLDELSQLLSGLNQYRRGQGSDRDRLLKLWTGASWRFDRVGSGGKRNAIRIRIPSPTAAICGNLQPERHELLGGDADGLRPRWLPHLAPLPDDEGQLPDSAPPTIWQLTLARKLIPTRWKERTWRLGPGARRAFEAHRRRWKRQARGLETETVSGALLKADIQCARIALVLAELQAPATGGLVRADAVHRAATIVEYTIDCWRALPEFGGLALSRRDWHLDQSIGRLISWLEEHGNEATRRNLLRAHVAGVRTAADLDELLKRYAGHYPGRVQDGVTPSGGGPETTVVWGPRRRGA